MIPTLQIDENHFTNTDEAYRPLLDAFQDVGPSPCTNFDCPRQESCSSEKVDCKAFRFWVNNGKLETKTKDGVVSIERDMQKILKKL
jgi:hypothetical protein